MADSLPGGSLPGALLEMRGISKAFPGVQALDETDLVVRAGEIHGLVGENGAGKSTIIKVLAGVYTRDAGEVAFDGVAVDELTPRIAHDAGVRFIHQELHLVPHFTVSESVFMGQEASGRLGLAKRSMKRRAETFLRESLNADIRGGTLIRDLGVAERKLVQIARALIDEQARLVVFDEPTAPLASGETEQVFRAVRRLREQGIAIVYVSHYLNEITELCDRVTVFRNGGAVAVLDKVDADDTDAIIHHMVGRELSALYPDRERTPGASLLAAEAIGDGLRFAGVTLDVKAGQILGVAGLLGSGREELIDCLYGLRRLRGGSMVLGGEPYAPGSAADAVRSGVVLVPRDRRHDGLVLDMDVCDNINLASLDEVATASFERRGPARKRAAALAERLDIRPRSVTAIARFLSGGNQQKVVLARWLATGSRVFILDEPTIGVDIGAKVEIYALIDSLAADGAAVIVSSSDPAELLGLCDRIAVLFRGKLIADRPGASLTLDALVALSTAGAAVQTAGQAA